MLYPINYREDSQKLGEAVSLQNQVKAVRLQDKLGEQNYHQNAEKLYKPLTDTIKDTSENLTQTITETYINNNKAIEKINGKFLELMKDKSLMAPYLVFPLVNLFKPEIERQFGFKKDLSSTEMNDFLINDGIPVTLFSNIITFRDSNKSFKLDGDLLETMTNFDSNDSHSNPKKSKFNLWVWKRNDF